MGPSGAGKSTLLHILGMHDHGWRGEYFLGETAVHHLKPKERATLRNEQIGFVFQQYHLLDDSRFTKTSISHCRIATTKRANVPRWWRTSSIGSKSSAKRICIRVSFPADNNSWSALRERSSPSRSFFSPMNRPEIYTPARAKRSWNSSVS